jgi:hypothetical protein
MHKVEKLMQKLTGGQRSVGLDQLTRSNGNTTKAKTMLVKNSDNFSGHSLGAFWSAGAPGGMSSSASINQPSKVLGSRSLGKIT